MKAKLAKELTEANIKEKQRTDTILKSLEFIFNLIENQIEKCRFTLHIQKTKLNTDQEVMLRNLGYKVSNVFGDPSLYSISWKE